MQSNDLPSNDLPSNDLPSNDKFELRGVNHIALVTSDIRSSGRMSGGFRLRLGARRCASAAFR